MQEKAKEPEIRFAGFTGAWEQRKVKDLAANTYGGGTPLTSNPEFWEGSIPWIQSSDLSEHNLFRVHPRKFISHAAVANSSVKIIPENSIAVITRVGVGKLAVMSFPYTTSQDFLSLSNLNTDVKFTSYQLYRRLQKDLNAVQGTSIKGITKEELLGKNIYIPGCQEQEAIGKFFSKIDSLLTLHQRKYEKLLNIKKSMLEKMFPKEGEVVPEIRFKGFTGAWEQREVSQLLLERNTQAPKSSEYPLMAFIANEGIAPKGERYDRSSLVTDEINKLYKRTERGDFIYSSNNLETGSIGLNNYGKASISPVYSIFSTTENADSDFIGHRLVRRDFIKAMVKWRQGVIYGQWRIHESDFLRISICAPSVPEQQKIGRFLRQIDTLLTLHQRKLEMLKNVKQAFLEKMFV